MTESKSLSSAEEFALWAEDEGALDDSLLLAWSDSELTIGLGVLEDAPADPREVFRKETDRHQPFTLRAVRQATIEITGEVAANAPFEYRMITDGDVFGVELNFGDASLRATAAEWSVGRGDEVVVPVERWTDAAEITFHGPGPVHSADLRAALAARGVECEFFGNWAGSGQVFGAAFVRQITTPPALVEDGPLRGAWRLVPTGAEASDARGLWITGQSSATSVYATVQRRAGTDRALVRAVADALASLPGVTWAVSGNTLIEDAAARDAWWSGPYQNDTAAP